MHRHCAAPADHDPHEIVECAVAQRHEIDQRRRARRRSRNGFQDQRVGAIAARDARLVVRWRDQPAAVLARPSSAAKQASESKRGQHSQSIEPSRPTSAGGPAIADQRVVFDAAGTGLYREGDMVTETSFQDADQFQEKSTTTLMSSGCSSSACVNCSSGTRRVISRASQALSARCKRIDGILIMLAVGIDAAKHDSLSSTIVRLSKPISSRSFGRPADADQTDDAACCGAAEHVAHHARRAGAFHQDIGPEMSSRRGSGMDVPPRSRTSAACPALMIDRARALRGRVGRPSVRRAGRSGRLR